MSNIRGGGGGGGGVPHLVCTEVVCEDVTLLLSIECTQISNIGGWV